MFHGKTSVMQKTKEICMDVVDMQHSKIKGVILCYRFSIKLYTSRPIRGPRNYDITFVTIVFYSIHVIY